MEYDDLDEAVKAMDSEDAALNAVDARLEELLAESAVSSNQLAPVDAARVNVVLAYALSSVFYLHLKASGTKVTNHRIMQEIKRVQEYKKRVEELIREQSGEKEEPMTTINLAAANRFVLHCVPDLTAQQKTALREAIRTDERGKQERRALREAAETQEQAAAAGPSQPPAGAGEAGEAAGEGGAEAGPAAGEGEEGEEEEAPEASPAKRARAARGAAAGKKSAGRGRSASRGKRAG